MALADYQPERFDLKVNGRLLAQVRGLNLDDLTALIRGNLSEMQQLYQRAQDRKQLPKTAGDVTALIASNVLDFPSLAATVIVLASDEELKPDNVMAARRLPLPTQLEALFEIARMTFEDVGGPLAFIRIVQGKLETLSLTTQQN